MDLLNQNRLNDLLRGIERAWKDGRGEEFARYFTREAHFIVFDGTVLTGAKEIASFHQRAFDTHLAGTSLKLIEDGRRKIGDDAVLLFTNGGIQGPDGRQAPLSGDSLQTMFVVARENQLQIDAFQNTRKRPIVDERSATAWKRFDTAWLEAL